MQLPQFLARVQAYVPNASQDDALAATRATLITLVELIGMGEARDMFAQLPAQFTQSLATKAIGSSEPFGAAEFVSRVGARGGFSDVTAEQDSRAVPPTLQKAISSGELKHISARLDPTITAFFMAPRPSSGR